MCFEKENCSKKQIDLNLELHTEQICTAGRKYMGVHDFLIYQQDCNKEENVALICEHQEENNVTFSFANNLSDVDVLSLEQTNFYQIKYNSLQVLCKDDHIRFQSRCLKVEKINCGFYRPGPCHPEENFCPGEQWFIPNITKQDMTQRKRGVYYLSDDTFIARFLKEKELSGINIRMNISALYSTIGKSEPFRLFWSPNNYALTKYHSFFTIVLVVCEQIPRKVDSSVTYSTNNTITNDTMINNTSFCPPPFLRCSDGTCLHDSLVCDGQKHCIEGEDESNCHNICSHITKSTPISPQYCLEQCHFADYCRCSHRYFQCLSGGCKPLYVLCDGIPQCKDSSDEPATCVYTRSSYNRNRAVSAKVQDYVHNRIQDHLNMKIKCMLGHDDFNHTGISFPLIPKHTCPEDETGLASLACHTSKVIVHNSIPFEQHCVLSKGCSNKLQCKNKFHLTKCKNMYCNNRFKCPASYCISLQYLCDGECDCSQCEDESFCSKLSCPGMILIQRQDKQQCIQNNDIVNHVV